MYSPCCFNLWYRVLLRWGFLPRIKTTTGDSDREIPLQKIFPITAWRGIYDSPIVCLCYQTGRIGRKTNCSIRSNLILKHYPYNHQLMSSLSYDKLGPFRGRAFPQNQTTKVKTRNAVVCFYFYATCSAQAVANNLK